MKLTPEERERVAGIIGYLDAEVVEDALDAVDDVLAARDKRTDAEKFEAKSELHKALMDCEARCLDAEERLAAIEKRDCPDCDNGVAPKGGNEGTTRYDCPTCRPEVLDCGDSSCRFAFERRGGMHTNGGCRCFQDVTPQSARRTLERRVSAHIAAIERRARLEGWMEAAETIRGYGGEFWDNAAEGLRDRAIAKYAPKAKALESEAPE